MKYFCLSFLLICSLTSLGQKHYTIISFGLQRPSLDTTLLMKDKIKCELAMHQKYGFEYSKNRGCVVKKRWMKHNERIRKKLLKRNGEGWQEKMQKEIDGCYN